jgi:ribonuclease HIII
MADFDAYCNSLLDKARAAGWNVGTQRSIPYGRQYDLTDSAGRAALLNAYSGKKGFSHVAGGKAAAALGADLGIAPAAPETAGKQTAGDPFQLGLPRAGGDESGKGDFFGPLVVSAFHLDAATAKQLAGSGIVDSKKLTDAAILKLAGLLDKTGRGHTITLMPREYNPQYREVGNLNLLLAQVHGRCMQALTKRLGAPGAILIDQFAANAEPLRKAVAPGAGVKFMTRTKAEADLAVACASVLARAAFVEGLKELGTEFGMEFPPGAGPPVIQAGRQFNRTFGREALGQVAKLHFKTREQL